MQSGTLAKALATIAAAAFISGCDRVPDSPFDGLEGKPLSQLDLSAKPSGLILLGPDEVRLRQGDRLAVTVDGDSSVAEALRFTISDGSLAVLRKPGQVLAGRAIVNVTMPAPASLVAAGSGTIRAESLAGDAAVTIAGSGDIETLAVAADVLKVKIAGSGSYRAAGTATRLDITIAGSGDAAMEALKTDSASVRILGSGRSAFASDGAVKASIAGSGEVRVHGRARCAITSAGTGKLICESDQAAAGN